ncbi:VWA domain-containing protein [Hahella sp. KA22]|uniref:vWA domain-containing protein n=1 Tax=Hahella sp. KA22 TaxID=1628392 RepID=UPI001F4F0167|nr:vWA domain-containing protein [Hahella sp. KA22]
MNIVFRPTPSSSTSSADNTGLTPFRKALLATAMLACCGFSGLVWSAETQVENVQPITQAVTQPAINAPRIQLAILLDTSSSMDGLINQTRNQLWKMVDEFSKAKKNGVTPILEVAVYEYGNDGLSSQNGYIRQVTGLTRELDRVSEALFSLTTNGGDEFCGYAINSAVKQLQWSQSSNDIRAIFIAGNEPFTQGPVSFREAIALAKQKDITVNTIFAGAYNEGGESGWRQGAQLAGGNYMSIDQDQQVAQIEAPQDKEIAILNARLNETYVPYGAGGAAASKRQYEQDANSQNVSLGLLAQRAKSKASVAYDNASWDLVDAYEAGDVALEEVEAEALPEPMVGMSKQEKEEYIETKKTERKVLQDKIKALSDERDVYIAEENRKAAKSDGNTVDEALISAIRKQGEQKAFEFK